MDKNPLLRNRIRVCCPFIKQGFKVKVRQNMYNVYEAFTSV